MVTTLEIDNARCELWIHRLAAGDSTARRELIDYPWPILIEMVRSNRAMRRVVSLEDEVHEVVTRIVEKLSRPEARGFHLYLPRKQRNAENTFEDWVRIVTKNMIRDYIRETVGPQRQASGEPSVKRLLNEFASAPVLDELGVRPPFTLAQTARELLEFAAKRLRQDQLHVLDSWLRGASFDELAEQGSITPESARQLLRSAVAVLCRNFTGEDSDQQHSHASGGSTGCRSLQLVQGH